MILTAHLDGACSHTIGDELEHEHETLAAAIRWEAEATVSTSQPDGSISSASKRPSISR
jgi:hypothetical protein